MKNRILLAMPALLVAVTLSAAPPPKTARADLSNAKGQKIGSATLRESKGGVKITLNVSQLPPGTHALHIHAAGKCDAHAHRLAAVTVLPSHERVLS